MPSPKMASIFYLDTILVPFSLFLMVGYHAYLWHCFKNCPSKTAAGFDALRRKTWFTDIKEGNDKKGMLAVQSLRNTQMTTIFTATITILVNLSLAALTNNTYKASHLFTAGQFLGLQSGGMYVLKFGSASLFLLVSFLCSSMGLAFLVDSNFLINASTEFSSSTYTATIFERGFVLAIIGKRILCMAAPLVIWMFGPLPVALSSVALIWFLYGFDFPGREVTSEEVI
ncbi:hypothetical protein Tsubulata_000130 [Turnera subulata]|uniref:DUF599 domain-containing protein n=1 Tax=Turnera subulata TaxID=218843 RepID=A0A9Q0J8S5_9ROSI|nr:hypothetical protein Tsubulata_000130 [Turnera subulata]